MRKKQIIKAKKQQQQQRKQNIHDFMTHLFIYLDKKKCPKIIFVLYLLKYNITTESTQLFQNFVQRS